MSACRPWGIHIPVGTPGFLTGGDFFEITTNKSLILADSLDTHRLMVK